MASGHVIPLALNRSRFAPLPCLGPQKNVDDVLPATVHQRRDLSSMEIVEPSAEQRVTASREIMDRRRKIELAVEPGLDGVLVGRHDIVQVAGHE